MAAIDNKTCPFCKAKIAYIDYKNLKTLSEYITSFGKISPRYYTGVCLKHQKMLSKAIKNARKMCLIPYIK